MKNRLKGGQHTVYVKERSEVYRAHLLLLNLRGSSARLNAASFLAGREEDRKGWFWCQVFVAVRLKNLRDELRMMAAAPVARSHNVCGSGTVVSSMASTAKNAKGGSKFENAES